MEESWVIGGKVGECGSMKIGEYGCKLMGFGGWVDDRKDGFGVLAGGGELGHWKKVPLMLCFRHIFFGNNNEKWRKKNEERNLCGRKRCINENCRKQG